LGESVGQGVFGWAVCAPLAVGSFVTLGSHFGWTFLASSWLVGQLLLGPGVGGWRCSFSWGGGTFVCAGLVLGWLE